MRSPASYVLIPILLSEHYCPFNNISHFQNTQYMGTHSFVLLANTLFVVLCNFFLRSALNTQYSAGAAFGVYKSMSRKANRRSNTGLQLCWVEHSWEEDLILSAMSEEEGMMGHLALGRA